MTIENWNIEEMTGYKPITTFYMDFSIADKFGVDAIKDTYKRGIESAKFLGYKELTEFVMVLNWKCWRWHEHNTEYCKLYSNLYYEALDYVDKNMTKEELKYFYKTTD